jgi:hypothetical protein
MLRPVVVGSSGLLASPEMTLLLSLLPRASSKTGLMGTKPGRCSLQTRSRWDSSTFLLLSQGVTSWRSIIGFLSTPKTVSADIELRYSARGQ